jgi:hypothetical protein
MFSPFSIMAPTLKWLAGEDAHHQKELHILKTHNPITTQSHALQITSKDQTQGHGDE